MKLEISHDPLIELELEGESLTDIDEEKLVAALAEHPAIIKIASDEGTTSGYERYTGQNDIHSKSVLATLGKAWADGGQLGIEEAIFEDDDWGTPAYLEYNERVRSDLESTLSEIFDSIEENFDMDIRERLLDALKDTCCEAMEEADKSTPADLFSSQDKVEMSYAIDLNVLGFDDMHLTYDRDGQFSFSTARPDANLMRMFKMFNISPAAFIDHLVANHELDLRIPDIKDGMQDYEIRDANRFAGGWQAFYDLATEGVVNRDYAGRLDLYEKRMLDEVVAISRTVVNIDRAPAFDLPTLMTVMEEASYGGIAVFTARYPVKAMLKGELEGDFNATGGFIGIHDFINGSGYVEVNESEVLINRSTGGFITNSIDGTYGMVPSFYNCATKPAENANWVHVAEDTWRSEDTKDRTYAEVWGEPLETGTVYWTSTYNKTGDQTGLYSESEAFVTLDKAQEAGLKAINMTPEELEAAIEPTGPKI